MQLTNISVSISMTDEHTKEGIMGIIRVDHVVENNGFKNKIWKHLERKVHVRFNIIQVLL
jgi:hypothetical protein